MKNNTIILNYFLIVMIGLFSSGCYTIMESPTEEQQSEYNQSDDNDSYTVINNYTCDHGSSCCGHDHCHTYSSHHNHSCGGYCQLTFNWWTGTYDWNYYHHGHHYGHHYGYYHNYDNCTNWWGYNNWDDDYNEDYSDDTQERRDRSFTRDDSDDNLDEDSYAYNSLETPNDDTSSNSSSPEPLIQKAPSENNQIQPKERASKNKKITYQRTNTHRNNKDLISAQSRKSSSYKYSSSTHSNKGSRKNRKSNNFSKRAGSFIDLIGIIASVSSSKKSNSKSRSKSYTRKSSSKKSKNKSTSKSGKSKKRR